MNLLLSKFYNFIVELVCVAIGFDCNSKFPAIKRCCGVCSKVK